MQTACCDICGGLASCAVIICSGTIKILFPLMETVEFMLILSNYFTMCNAEYIIGRLMCLKNILWYQVDPACLYQKNSSRFSAKDTVRAPLAANSMSTSLTKNKKKIHYIVLDFLTSYICYAISALPPILLGGAEDLHSLRSYTCHRRLKGLNSSWLTTELQGFVQPQINYHGMCMQYSM